MIAAHVASDPSVVQGLGQEEGIALLLAKGRIRRLGVERVAGALQQVAEAVEGALLVGVDAETTTARVTVQNGPPRKKRKPL